MKVTRFAQLADWNPGSPKLVLEYCRSKNFNIPKHRKTKKPTTDDSALERLIQKNPVDPVLPLIREARAIGKAKGYLSDAFVGNDLRFHSEFTFHPETSRLSSRRPNLTNQPNPDRMQGAEARAAKKIRGTIQASPGMLLLERDYKSEESLLLGYFAEDPTYMRLSRLGNYSYFTSLKVGKPVDLNRPDSEVLKDLDKIKKEHSFDRQLFKVIILALGYGEGTYAMARHLEPFFIEKAKVAALVDAQTKRWWKDVKGEPFHDPRVTSLVAEIAFGMAKNAAEDYRKIYLTAAPKVAQWQEHTRNRAHKEKRLTNPFGMSLDFFEVYKKQGAQWVLGSEANKALAYLPQSTGAGILKEALLTLDKETSGDPDFHMLVPVHDAILCECLESKVDHYSLLMKQIMEAPIKVLNGLVIETEAKVGRAWSWENDEGN